ncbi:modifier of mdg4-like isoform X5 [Uranotaenia lowii]|uniref:modifier of mdg4-like isoform X5 n=1 Tax=Uranotaenia lowii TaxID=190385 RepID=UPI0024791C04|nr:modifier of mdg4-like isoform X5 [Uranotaenia lowii]
MADDEQFSLCWNNFNTNLSAGFHESLIRGDLVDVTLAAEGQLVKAHRLILSVCSPYFRKMFTQMPANQHAFIFLKDVSHSALKDLIQFMYCGEVNVKQDALPAFISTAEALQIKGLTESGESAPPHQSPAKETSHHIVSSMVSIPSNASSPRAKPIQRTRIQSYKPDSEDGSDHEKIVQIQAQSTPIVAASSSSSGQSATIVTQVTAAPQQIQILQQTAQKRTITQRASITPQTTQIMKRAKLSDPLEATEPTQIQTVQIVKQITPTPQPSISSEPEYVEMPIETINPKAEPEYADDPSEVEAIDTEHEQEQALAEHETDHDQGADDSANYVEDETYGDMSKYDETYFTEGDDAKAGASGFGTESYTEGTSTDQAAQATTSTRNDYRNNPSEFELAEPLTPWVFSSTSHRKINQVAQPTESVPSPVEPWKKQTRASKKSTMKKARSTSFLDMEAIVAKETGHTMVMVPTRRGPVGVEFDGHHFEYHYGKQSHKLYRCAWHSQLNCPAQVLAFDRKVYVVCEEHSHRESSTLDAHVLGKQI